jgi:hypothetical protein
LIKEVSKLNEACSTKLLQVREQPDAIALMSENAAMFAKCSELLEILRLQQMRGASMNKDDVE